MGSRRVISTIRFLSQRGPALWISTRVLLSWLSGFKTACFIGYRQHVAVRFPSGSAFLFKASRHDVPVGLRSSTRKTWSALPYDGFGEC